MRESLLLHSTNIVVYPNILLFMGLHYFISFAVFVVQFSRCVLNGCLLCYRRLVGTSGFEPPTSRLSGVRSNRLSYKPIFPASRLSGHPATVAVPLLLRSSGASFDSPASLRRFPSLRFSAGQNRALPVVEINGIEPLTSCLQSRRSPS